MLPSALPPLLGHLARHGPGLSQLPPEQQQQQQSQHRMSRGHLTSPPRPRRDRSVRDGHAGSLRCATPGVAGTDRLPSCLHAVPPDGVRRLTPACISSCRSSAPVPSRLPACACLHVPAPGRGSSLSSSALHGAFGFVRLQPGRGRAICGTVCSRPRRGASALFLLLSRAHTRVGRRTHMGAEAGGY